MESFGSSLCMLDSWVLTITSGVSALVAGAVYLLLG